MSIIIKGMEMPDSCFHCKLAEVCQYYKAEHYANKRHEDCPLEEALDSKEQENDKTLLKSEHDDVSKDDFISRQAAIDALDGEIEITGRMNAEAVKGYVRLVKDRIERLSSAQPEIIRCKDCKYIRRYRNEQAAKKFGQIYECAIGVFMCPQENDFCSHAERREDESD